MAIVMWIISTVLILFSWKKVKKKYSSSITSLLAIMSAFVFAAQMINFPIAFGTSGHLIGGTFLAILLGPFAAILSMTIVLLMQAVFFADGGIIAFGMNAFNMAVIGGLSYFFVKPFLRNSFNYRRFVPLVFLASWLSVMIGALLCSIEVAPAFSGGLNLTLPSMMIFHSIIGVGEGAITVVLIASISKFHPKALSGINFLKDGKNL